MLTCLQVKTTTLSISSCMPRVALTGSYMGTTRAQSISLSCSRQRPNRGTHSYIIFFCICICICICIGICICKASVFDRSARGQTKVDILWDTFNMMSNVFAKVQHLLNDTGRRCRRIEMLRTWRDRWKQKVICLCVFLFQSDPE